MNRRRFLSLVPAGLVAARSARAADAEIRVFANEPGAAISPMMHGHFIEHLGGVIYDGVWVGENSKIANIGGIRKALVDAMPWIRHVHLADTQPRVAPGESGKNDYRPLFRVLKEGGYNGVMSIEPMPFTARDIAEVGTRVLDFLKKQWIQA